MQNAKDTFYITLRNRLATINPARTMTLRSVMRPAIYVEEAESPQPLPILDAYALRWTGTSRLAEMPLPLMAMSCQIFYSTAGTQSMAGLDRGRVLAAMDAEVEQMLSPLQAQKMLYSSTGSTPMQTMIFWSEPQFEPIVAVRDQLSRIAQVTLWSWQEASES